ncbi:amidase [Microlunatus endophyticus]|uniref:Amidase n=1 Tax=Microlunatus endophyticus TaxID=1716077 RepID=A0A917SEJ7_9ACTN|nr:amidase family protein [Microlunatus endophyticus]GGL74895.1 amidase [Microlunatus endophyticus]
MTASGPAFDRTIWRTLGDPLVAGDPAGPLHGRTAAVKDLYAIAGHPVGAGVAAWLAEQRPAVDHAAAVCALLEAGVDITGITRTDQFAFSMAGQNADYGTPPNAAAPGRIPGGSSSGSASAVALGQVDLALGTDTGGSVRVPASYQGIWGIRTTHDLVDRTGLLDLAPSFDTVGWFTREAGLLFDIGRLLVPETGRRPLAPSRVLIAPALQLSTEPDIAETAARTAARAAELLGLAVEEWPLPPERLDEWVTSFRTIQSYEAWQIRGNWITTHPGALAAEVEARFIAGRAATEEQVALARGVIATAGEELSELIKEAVLIQPAASSAPPPVDEPALIEQVRGFTQRQTCIAGIGGLPSVSVPGLGAGPLPYNVCLVGAPGTDLDLIELAGRLTES